MRQTLHDRVDVLQNDLFGPAQHTVQGILAKGRRSEFRLLLPQAPHDQLQIRRFILLGFVGSGLPAALSGEIGGDLAARNVFEHCVHQPLPKLDRRSPGFLNSFVIPRDGPLNGIARRAFVEPLDFEAVIEEARYAGFEEIHPAQPLLTDRDQEVDAQTTVVDRLGELVCEGPPPSFPAWRSKYCSN